MDGRYLTWLTDAEFHKEYPMEVSAEWLRDQSHVGRDHIVLNPDGSLAAWDTSIFIPDTNKRAAPLMAVDKTTEFTVVYKDLGSPRGLVLIAPHLIKPAPRKVTYDWLQQEYLEGRIHVVRNYTGELASWGARATLKDGSPTTFLREPPELNFSKDNEWELVYEDLGITADTTENNNETPPSTSKNEHTALYWYGYVSALLRVMTAFPETSPTHKDVYEVVVRLLTEQYNKNPE